MTRAIAGSGAPASAALLPPESPPRNTEPALRNLWGLLTVQAGSTSDEQNNPQLEAALRIIDGTEIGAALLRALAACDLPARERPMIAFFNLDSYGDSNFPPDEQAADDGRVIHFAVEGPVPFSDTASTGTRQQTADDDAPDRLAPRNHAIDLFADLATFLAGHTGQECLAPSLGSVEYSTLTFREQLGDEIPPWQYSLQAYARKPLDQDENRAAVWELVNLWSDAGNPNEPLRLNSLKLRECPPLHDVPGLTWLILADNALTGFPSRDSLPPGLNRIDLAGNPIETPADDYSPDLRHVILDRTVCENTSLRSALPPHAEITEVDADYIETFEAATQFMTEFPETLVNMVPVEDMERAGWSNNVMARLYPKDMLEKAVAKWLAPTVTDTPALAPDDRREIWRRAQQADPNGAAALSALLDRVHAGWEQQPMPAFREQFVALLTKMCLPENAGFLDKCLSIAREGAASCDDQILYTLNNLHIASLNADVEAGQYDDRPVELLHHAEDMLNVHTLTQFFASLRPELQRRAREKQLLFDEVEQWLHLHTRLQHAVHLPAMQFRMQFAYLSLVNDTDTETARIQIRRARDTGFLDFLASWSPLQSVIRRTSPRLAEREYKWRDHIYNDRGRVYGALDRVMKTEGRLFASPHVSEMRVFSVGPRMFWTRYERLVDKLLAEHGLDREMPDVLPPACRATAEDIQKLIQRATVRDFLTMHGLKLQQAIQDTGQPRWFKRLRKSIP